MVLFNWVVKSLTPRSGGEGFRVGGNLFLVQSQLSFTTPHPTLPAVNGGRDAAQRIFYKNKQLLNLKAILFLLLSLLFITPSFAVEPNEILSDPAQEQRARNLSLELRCLVCQNQSIDDSNAGLAKDLRIVVRERILAGDSDEAVKTYLVARYGEFVLLKPSFSTHNFLLWTLPFFGLAMGVFLAFRRRISGTEIELSEDEKHRLKLALGENP